VISGQDYFPFYRYRTEFEKFVPAFCERIAKHGSIIFLVGIRANEPLNRHRAVRKREQTKKAAFHEISWSSRHGPTGSAVSFNPVYDSHFSDI